MALPKIGLEAILKLTNFTKGMKQYTQGVGSMGKISQDASKKMSGIGKSIQGGFSNLGPIVAATGAFLALNKAIEFGKEGATIAQTEASFNGLMTSMGVAPDILQQMRDATLGTVDDMTLMSSTMTLLAGTSEKLGSAMVDNAPRLLEIAKAANKLNPSLGDTAFLYNSLATGIKRSSPLILDNLGLVVKVGDANEVMAAKLNKSVEALTAEEKSMALLEAALVAGDRMIEQVGGSVEAMGDKFAEAQTNLKNTSDELKVRLLPAVAAATEELARFLIVAGGDLPAELAKMIDANKNAGKSFGQLAEEAREAKAMIIYGGPAQEEAKLFWIDMSKSVKLTAEELIALGLAADQTWPQIVALAEAMGIELDRTAWADYAEVVLNAARAVEPWIERQQMAEEAQRKHLKSLAAGDDAWFQYIKRMREAELGITNVTITTDDLAKAQKALDAVIKDIRKSYEDFFGSLSTGIGKLRELGDAQTQSAKDYAKSLADLNKDAKKAYDDVRNNFEASLPDATTVADRMGMAGDAWDEWALRIQAIIEGGVSNPWYQVLQDMGYQKPPDVGLVEWLEGLKTKFYEGKLPDLLPPEWAENVKTQQEAATAVVQAENAKRAAAVKAARDAELAAEKEARDRATVELALTLAENSKQLEEWSRQRFGEDMFGIADTAKEVLGLLDSGMLDIDAALQKIITDSVLGVQTALDTTGQQAGETAKLLDELVSPEFIAEKQAEIQAALDLEAAEIAVSSSMVAIGATVTEAIPKTAFDVMLENFYGVSDSIVTQATLMGLDLGSTFDTIDLDWAAMVGSQVKSWDKGMGEVQKAIQEKVIEKLDEIPTKIVVTVTTEQEGGEPTGKQSGGPVMGGVPYVVGEAGPELFVPASRGTIIPSMDLGMSLPGMFGMGGGGTSFGPTITLNMSPTINNGMDVAEFEARTLATVQQAIRGA